MSARRLLSVLLGVTIIVIVGRFVPVVAEAVDTLEWWTVEQRFSWRAHRPVDPRLLIISLTEDTYRTLNRPIFAYNALYAQLIHGAVQASAAAVFLDAELEVGNDPAIREMVTGVLASMGQSLPAYVLNNRLGFDVPLRRALAGARGAGLPVFLCMRAPDRADERQACAEFANLVPQPLPFYNLVIRDRTVREHQVFAFDERGLLVPSTALALAQVAAPPATFSADGRLLLAGRPVDGLVDRRAFIDYAGPSGHVPQRPLHNVLQGLAANDSATLDLLRGKLLLVGDWTWADRRVVPIRRPDDRFSTMQGVEIHAQVVDNLLRHRFLRELPTPWPWLALVLLLTCHGLAWEAGAGIGIAVGVCAGLGWTVTAMLAFAEGWLIALALPLTGLLVQAGAYGWRQYRHSERQRLAIRHVFSRYVNDKVVERVLARSGTQMLQGERRTIVCLICDIRNFTTFSENRDPATVVAFLNRALSGITDIVLAHDGLVDKFLGDGLMALFNAPVDSPDFARRAVQASLAIERFFGDLVIAEGLADAGTEPGAAPAGQTVIRIGAALHLGEAIVGNLGSERKMEYTAIGDVVNTTSRLEALNKKFGSSILASAEVKHAAGTGFVWESLGSEQLRGRQQSLEVFALRGAAPVDGGPQP